MYNNILFLFEIKNIYFIKWIQKIHIHSSTLIIFIDETNNRMDNATRFCLYLNCISGF